MRELFAVLEQQRTSRDAIENLGPPNQQRFQEKMRRVAADESIQRQKSLQEAAQPKATSVRGTSRQTPKQ